MRSAAAVTAAAIVAITVVSGCAGVGRNDPGPRAITVMSYNIQYGGGGGGTASSA